MLACSYAGDSDAAIQHAAKLGELESVDAEIHLERARAYGQLAKLAAADSGGKLDSAKQAKDEAARTDTASNTKVNSLIDSALSALERSIDEGFADPFRINVESELEMIRNSDRFERALRLLAAKVGNENQ